MRSPFEMTLEAAASEEFWARAGDELDWITPPTQTLHLDNPPFTSWFEGGELNSCYNAVDRHVDAGQGNKTALIFDSAMTDTKARFTYRELQKQVARTAGMIKAQGIEKGDTVIIYMPMIPETVFAMLACARLGVIHSVVFGGFAANELAKRIDDAKPKLLLSASCGLEPARIVEYKPLVDDAINMAAHKPDSVIILQRKQHKVDISSSRDKDWAKLLKKAEPADCVKVASSDPLYILYTSGTTGVPKGVVRDNGGHAAALLWSMRHVYDVNPSDVYWAASDVGWVVGHSYIVYGPLFLGCTTVLYEGKPVGTPDAAAFWRMIEEYKITTLFTAPTAIRAIKREDPKRELIGKYNLASLRALFLAGERADPDTVYWSQNALNVPVIDHWWQTELGWPAIATCLGLGEREIRVGSAGRRVPGFTFDCLGPDHKSVDFGESGDIVLKLPLPPGCLKTLWNNVEGYIDSYLKTHPGYYLTGDAGFIDEDGYIHVMSRTDDIINVAGHRLATGAIEQVISAHKDVAECAVVGAPDTTKGEVPMGFIVLNSNCSREHDEVIDETVSKVRNIIGPVAAFKKAYVVTKLPKTRSGKTLRGNIKNIVHKESFRVPPTIEDASALDVIRKAIA